MKEQIKQSLNTAAELEVLFQQNPDDFETAFREISAEMPPSALKEAWLTRLDAKSVEKINAPPKEKVQPTFPYFVDLLTLLAAILFGWFIAKLPVISNYIHFLHISDDFPFANLSLMIFPAISLYWTWKREIPWRKIAIIFAIFIPAVVLVNFLPTEEGYNIAPDTTMLAYIFLPILWWIMIGIALFPKGEHVPNNICRLIPRTGEILVVSGLVALLLAIVAGIATALFSTVGIELWEMLDWLYIPLAISVPLTAVWLTEIYPQLASTIVTFLARCFIPLVLLILSIYLIMTVFDMGENIFSDRNFLITFNIALFATTALIFFALGDLDLQQPPRWLILSSGALCMVAAIMTGIVMYFLVSRTISGGFTPNRTAAFGVDLILGIQLVTVGFRLLAIDSHKSTFAALKKFIATPFYAYAVWSAFVILLLPVIFRFK